MRRISIAGMLGLVAVVAIGLAALRSSSEFWRSLTLLMMLGLLCASVLGVVHGRGRRAWWLGFALFGWAFFLAGLVPILMPIFLSVSSQPALFVFEVSSDNTPYPEGPRDIPGVGMFASPGLSVSEFYQRKNNATWIGHWLVVLLFARVGATVSCLMLDGFSKGRGPADAPPSG